MKLVPVDYDPFAPEPTTGPKLVPVDYDPFAEQSLLETIKSQPGQAAQATQDILRLVGKGVAMGKEATAEDMVDRSIALQGIGRRMARGQAQQVAPLSLPEAQRFVESERRNVAEAEQRADLAGDAAQIIGTLGPASAMARVVGAGARGLAAIPGLGRVAANPFTQAAVTGAGMGALDAAGTDKDMGESALWGAGAGLAGQAVGNVISGTVGKLAGALNKKPVIPSPDQLRAAKDAAYKAADDAGVIYTPQLIGRIKQGIESNLADKAFLPANQPRVANVLAEIDKLQGKNVTLKGLDAIRQMAGDAYEIGNKKSNALIYDVIRNIDDAIGSAKGGEVIMGNAGAGAAAIKEARRLNTQISKLDTLAQALTKAERNAASSGTGGNIDNTIRQQFRSILNSPAKSRGLTPDEKAAMETIVRGTDEQNLARLFGRLSPQGNGLMAMMQAMGAVQSGGTTLPLVGVGMAAKTIADRTTPKNVDELAKIIAAGGKRSEAFAPPNAVQLFAHSSRELLARALMNSGLLLSPAP